MREISYYFGIFDFDGTAAKTFSLNKKGIGVNQAYKIACGEIFGCPLGLSLFDKVGGLQNRAPSEFVDAILEAGNRDQLIAKAREYAQKHRTELDGYIPRGKGVDLTWNNGCFSSFITELLVRVKLRLLTAQIGTPCDDGTLWPNPCMGFVELWRSLLAFNETSTEVKFVPGIISSGHDFFIKQCFAMWGLPEPEFMVTDDTMRSDACTHLSAVQKMKPQVGPVRIFCEQWLKKQERNIDGDPLSCIEGRGFYGGDALQADGGLAENLDLCFLWFNPEGKIRVNPQSKIVNVKDWRDIIDLLTSEKAIDMMMAGTPFVRIAHTLFSRS